MLLNDLTAPTSSKQINRQIKEHFGSTIDFTNMTIDVAKQLQESASKKLNEVKTSPKFFTSEQDFEYLQTLMFDHAIKQWIREYYDRAPKSVIGGAVGAVGKFLDKATGEHFEKAKRESEYGYAGVALDVLKSKVNKYKTDIDKLSKPSAKLDKNEIVRQLTKLGQKYKELVPFIERIKDDQLNKKELEQIISILAKLQNQPVTESIIMEESPMENAQVVLAAKDMADRLQDMVEKLSKMLNEEVPPLSNVIHDHINPDTAKTWNETVSNQLTQLLELAKTSRDEVSNAARVLSGEEVNQLPNEPIESSTAEPTSREPRPEINTEIPDQEQ